MSIEKPTPTPHRSVCYSVIGRSPDSGDIAVGVPSPKVALSHHFLTVAGAAADFHCIPDYLLLPRAPYDLLSIAYPRAFDNDFTKHDFSWQFSLLRKGFPPQNSAIYCVVAYVSSTNDKNLPLIFTLEKIYH